MNTKFHFSRGVLCASALALGLVAGCGSTISNKERLSFHGIEFNTKAKATDKKVSRHDFTVTVKKATQSLDGAKAAGGYEGKKYCIDTFGSSDVAWTSGPDAENTQLYLDGDTLILQGTCTRTW